MRLSLVTMAAASAVAFVALAPADAATVSPVPRAGITTASDVQPVWWHRHHRRSYGCYGCYGYYAYPSYGWGYGGGWRHHHHHHHHWW